MGDSNIDILRIKCSMPSNYLSNLLSLKGCCVFIDKSIRQSQSYLLDNIYTNYNITRNNRSSRINCTHFSDHYIYAILLYERSTN